ncbi:hypothetical protein BKA70DRAFT_1421286 [Coprinopsis sp. MPI-PUGE-AT-0042]|nr:hypothetical protein BKA70DRAFT_1421286 [Coprinopsis sp. MPI-PUGE-AT-0042]
MLFSALLLHTVYGCLPWNLVMGAPTQVSPTPTDEPPSTEIPFNTNYRSTTDIVWSCVVTVFACTWLSVHPNISGANTTWKQRMRRRLFLMLWGIAAPEFLVIFAYRQWRGSRDITRTFRKIAEDAKLDIPTRKSWTNAHSHFLQMGGFMFQKPNGDDTPHFIDVQQLSKQSHEAGRQGLRALLMSSPTEDDIWDKSKGDTLAKAIVALQTTWFLTQILGRIVQRLTITELEVVTLAYAAFNAAMYAFWWNKPLDVQCPILVPFAGLEELHLYDTASRFDTLESLHFAPLGSEGRVVVAPHGSSLAPATNHDLGSQTDVLQPQPQTSSNPQSTFSLLSSIFGSVLGALRRPLEIMHHVYIVTGFKRSGENYVFSVFEHRVMSCITFLAATWYSWTLQVPTYRTLYEFLRLLVIKVLAPFHNKVFIPILLPSYLLARFVLIALAFAQLRKLPKDAHQTVEWSDFLPHV